MHFSAAKLASLARLMGHLMEATDTVQLREQLGHDLLELLNADYFASYVWQPGLKRFDEGVAINMDRGNLSTYERYYQFHDPLTFRMQQHRAPALVSQVMPMQQLTKTEFFNDFLARDGLHFGVNLFAWTRGTAGLGPRNIGDLRIWRARQRGDFDAEALELLSLIQPAFVAGIERLTAAAPPGTQAWSRLSTREREIAQLAAQGLSDRAIAKQLEISFGTVRTHLGHIYEKLEVAGRVQLAWASTQSERAGSPH